ncbi:MAG TPA: PEP-CTERM sorting domain-containing protein [Burkholderiaceae bacterium]
MLYSRTQATRRPARSKRPATPGALLLAAAIALPGASALAAPVVYTGYDNHVSTLSLNAVVAAETFYNAAAPRPSIIDFESPLPAGVSITGDGEQVIDTDCGAGCGFNTSPGGTHFLQLAGTGANVTFTFSTPVTAFGFYVTGLQSSVLTGERVTFDDGSAQFIPVAPVTNGDAFIGFIDLAGVTSVTYEATLDVVGIDDVWYGSQLSAVPEPATFAMVGAGLIGVGLARRRRA